MRTIVDLDFFEDGWLSAFGLLLCPDVCDLDMNVGGPYAADLSPGVVGPTEDRGVTMCTDPEPIPAASWRPAQPAVRTRPPSADSAD